MQTFLPFMLFETSLAVLDYKRLGKQRVEAYQIIKSLENPAYGYKYHPVKDMWREHIEALKLYHNLCIDEWIARGYNNTMAHYHVPSVVHIPVFDEQVYLSHRSNLVRKNAAYYGEMFPQVPNDLEYVWSKPISQFEYAKENV